MSETPVTEREKQQNWLMRMHSLLEWRATYPECNNPFAKPMSQNVLEELSEEKEILRKFITLKARVDGEEIITIKDIPGQMEIITDHPALTSMNKKDIKRYLETFGIEDLVNRTIDQAQQEYKEELLVRSSVHRE